MLSMGLAATGCGDDPITSDEARESAIEQISERLGMDREEVLGVAEGFCTAVSLSDSVEDYGNRILEIDEGISLILTESTETMTRIGGCEQEYFDIGGSYDESSDAYRTLEELTTPEVIRPASTPIPEVGSGGPAALTLDNGDTYEFDATCATGIDDVNRYTIEADNGSQTLAVSSDEMRSSDEEPSSELLSIIVTDSDSGALLWYADNVFGNLDVTVTGADVRAEGLFSRDLANIEGTDGTFTATC